MTQIEHTVSGFGLILIKHMGIFYDFTRGLLNHMCQINHTCVTFSTREYVPKIGRNDLWYYYRLELHFKGKGWKPVRPKVGTKNIW